MSPTGTLRVQELEFTAGPKPGTHLTVNPGAVTVFIGPNNGGKSRALKEIAGEFSGELPRSSPRLVINAAKITPLSGAQVEARCLGLSEFPVYKDDINRRTVKVTSKKGAKELRIDSIIGYMKSQNSDFEYQHVRLEFLKYFMLELVGSNRLSLLSPGNAQNLQGKPLSLAAAFLLDNDIRHKLSKICSDAFGFHLVIDPSAMSSLVFSSSSHEPPEHLSRSFSDEALNFFRNCLPIEHNSDGTRAFVGILAEIFAGTEEIIVIDEPEAFLHPSLARKLAQEIAVNIGDCKQAFIATHSASFLSGLVSSNLPIDIVRLSRRSNVSSARALEASKIKSMMQDPLLRSANLLEALFFESCIIVEGDGDAAFYREINDRLHAADRAHISHGTFVTAHSKQSIHRFSKPLREIGIPAACVLDIDWLKEDGAVGRAYFLGCGVPDALIPSLLAHRRSTRQALETVDQNYKKNGGITLLSGSEREAAEEFFSRCESYGLFTVKSGELESWLPELNVVRAKSKWIAAIFDAMGSDPNAGEYITPNAGGVWEFLGRINAWISDPQRKGMP